MYFLDTVASREAASSNVLRFSYSPFQYMMRQLYQIPVLHTKEGILMVGSICWNVSLHYWFYESDIQYHYFYSTFEIFMICNYFYSTSGISVGHMSIMFPKSRHTCAGGLSPPPPPPPPPPTHTHTQKQPGLILKFPSYMYVHSCL